MTVYPPQRGGEPWRAVWAEDGRRRFREAVSEEKLAAKLEKVTERLQADAPNMERPGADLIAWYLSPDRRRQPWSRKHADTQRRLCARFIAPVIGSLACQDIKTADMQRAVNAAPTDGEGERLRRCISALVTAGIAGGYLTAARLKDVHWQPGQDRPAPPPAVSVAGESALFVDPAEIPGHADVAKLGQALAVLRDLHELMACTAAYSGLRWGELTALTIRQIDLAARVITVDRKVIEVGGKMYLEAPKNRKQRRTIYPRTTPAGYPLAERLAARIEQARAGQAAGTNPLGLMFPSPRGTYWRSSNFARRVLAPAYLAAGWRDPRGATGPGTACGTCSAQPPCSAGSSTPPTFPPWPGTPTSASPSTCTSAPPPASSTAPAPPPNSSGRSDGEQLITDARNRVGLVEVAKLAAPGPPGTGRRPGRAGARRTGAGQGRRGATSSTEAC